MKRRDLITGLLCASGAAVVAHTAFNAGGTLDISRPTVAGLPPTNLADVLADLARRNPDILLYEVAGQALFPFYVSSGGLSARYVAVFCKGLTNFRKHGWGQDSDFDFPSEPGYKLVSIAPETGYVAFTFDLHQLATGPNGTYVSLLDGIGALKKV